MLPNDLIFTAGAILFTLALIPLIYDTYKFGGDKYLTLSALFTASVLSVYTISYLDLGLYFAAVPHTAIAWWIIAYLSWRKQRTTGVKIST